jgi:transposase, IS30 family
VLYHQLTQEERYTIASGLALKLSMRQIAETLGRPASTVSREIARNATTHDGFYRGLKAHSYAMARRRRARRGPHYDHYVMRHVWQALRQKWSPRQIWGTFREAGKPCPSPETIYRYLRRDKRLGGSLCRHTRIMSKMGRKRYRSRPARGRLLGKRHISERPTVIEQRLRVGDWEGDTVMGRGSSHCLLTLVERKSGLVIIRKLKARNTEEAIGATIAAIAKLRRKFKSLTFDNGTEFHGYERIEKTFGITVYFATPYHSWERGSNENLNGLIRQYLPKGTNLRKITQERCDSIARQLNSRPRERHGFLTPDHVFAQS